MKNFGTLYGYELKKLLRRKLAWIIYAYLLRCEDRETYQCSPATKPSEMRWECVRIP